jgi:hypothetical protein
MAKKSFYKSKEWEHNQGDIQYAVKSQHAYNQHKGHQYIS